MKSLFKISKIGFLLLISVSCSISDLYKASKDENVTFKENGIQQFEIVDNSIILELSINGTTIPMMFDTRAPSILFTNNKAFNADTTRIISTFGKSKSADRKTIKNQIVSIGSAENNLLKINNWVVRILEWPKKCDSRSGIIGQDLFDIHNQKILIDFDNKQFKLFDKMENMTNWTELKSKFSNGNITLFLTINGEEYPFGFDTGFNGSIYMKEEKRNDEIISKLAEKNQIYGLLFYSAAGATFDTIINKLVKEIRVSDSIVINNVTLGITDKISNNLVGMKFIQNFNFAIDYPSKRIFSQPRKTKINKESAALENFGAGISLLDGKLCILSLIKDGIAESDGFLINDEILIANGIEISNLAECDKNHTFRKALINNQINTIILKRGDKLLEKKVKLYNL